MPQQNEYAIVWTKRFVRDVRRARRRGCDMRKLECVMELLRCGELPSTYRNHRLEGEMEGYDECHIGPDWLLVYWRRKDRLVLVMLQTGTHADLFGE